MPFSMLITKKLSALWMSKLIIGILSMVLNNLNTIFSVNYMNQAFGLPCPNGCGRSYKGRDRKHNLNRHLKYACGINPQFNCTFCEKQFKHKRSLQNHLVNVHQEKIL